MKFDYIGSGFRDFLREKLKNKRTADRYFFAVCHILRPISFSRPEEIELQALQERLDRIDRKSDLSAAKQGLQWLKRYAPGLTLPSPSFWRSAALKRESTGPPSVTIPLDPIRRKISALRDEKFKYAYRLMLCSGLRVSETAALTAGDIVVDGDIITVHVRHGKGGSNGKVRCMPDAYLAERLRIYLHGKEPDEPLFPSYETLRQRARDLGIECHDLRRIAAFTYRDKCLQGGSTPEEADEATKDFLRHRKFETTRRYLYGREFVEKNDMKKEQNAG